ncbi:MAG: Smr/MutS family protein [Chitinophagales bacterium]|nr:hypothetical protein [Chitinophagales bacterium]MDW8392860.1 Smr/MutS family protein [Chitinophagales bacterium]
MSRFRVGQQVTLAESGKQGTVCAVQEGPVYLIQTAEGRHWVEERQLLTEPQTQSHQADASACLEPSANALWLAFRFPPDDWSHLDVWLINHTPWHFRFSYTFCSSGEALFSLKERTIRPQEQFPLHDIKAEWLNEKAYANITLDNRQIFPSQHVIEQRIRPQSVVAGSGYVPQLKHHGKLLELPLPLKRPTSEEPLQIRDISLLIKNLDTPVVKRPRPAPANDVVTVDLHAEKLPLNVGGLTSNEILQAQLRYAEKQLDQALQQGMRKIVFVHGVGSGILREQLHQRLQQLGFSDFRFSFHPLHGYGATEVILH